MHRRFFKSTQRLARFHQYTIIKKSDKCSFPKNRQNCSCPKIGKTRNCISSCIKILHSITQIIWNLLIQFFGNRKLKLAKKDIFFRDPDFVFKHRTRWRNSAVFCSVLSKNVVQDFTFYFYALCAKIIYINNNGVFR